MDKDCIKVLQKLEEKNYQAYLVGGYPRDLYMGNISSDYDICTSAKPKDIKNIFNKYIVSSEKYGCVTIFYHNKRFEITTLRKDITYFNNRFPLSLKYVKDLKTDLLRRDFRMNTICLNSKGEYIDLLNGREDIDNRIISVVGDSDKKIREDALRILRAIRFATILDFELDDKLMSSIKKYKSLVKNLSYERKKEELDKIFSNSNALKGIRLIKDLNLDKYLDLKLDNIHKVNNIIGYWVQVDTGKYHFTKTESEQINKVREIINKRITNDILYRYGLYVCTIVAELQGIDIKDITQKYNNLPIKNRQDILLEPLEICEILNRKPDSWLKDVISDIEQKIVNNELQNDKLAIIDYIKENY